MLSVEAAKKIGNLLCLLKNLFEMDSEHSANDRQIEFHGFR